MSGEEPASQAATSRGSSPYATGGGGVSFAHRMAAIYLASMLTGGRRPELDELPVTGVSFQTGPDHPVDDLLISGSTDEADVTLAIACRANPNFVQSDDSTVALMGSLLNEVARFDGETHRVAVATAGSSSQWSQVATLCDVARAHASPESFRASIGVDQRWTRQVRDRLDQVVRMVERTVDDSPSPGELDRLTWRLLSRLYMLPFRLQSPDKADRTNAATALDSVASDASDGVALRDRLEAAASDYDSLGAVVDRDLLRRDVHSLLKAPLTRRSMCWQVLGEHRRNAVEGVRTSIGEGSQSGPLEISFTERRDELAEAVRAAGTSPSVLVVSGESGTGKSALMLAVIAHLEATDPDGVEAAVVNFRNLPGTTMELSSALGTSIESVLAEMSAPCRLLVIDAADAALERSASLLSDLVVSATAAGVGVVAATSDTAAGFVKEQIAVGLAREISEFIMEPLRDDDVTQVADHFPLLRTVLRNVPRNSLLRRMVVLDLLARTGQQVAGSMGEWDCLQLIWSKVVRADGRSAAGSPEAREQTLLAIAAATLGLPPSSHPTGSLDAESVDALRRDHLLAPANLYRDQPEFAHDEVRRYAVAILLVRSPDIGDRLVEAGVPRWALSAATLACKGMLLQPDIQAPTVFSQTAEQFGRLAEQHGARWADVPIEAVLEVPSAYECLSATLQQEPSVLVLGDVVRVVQQRHRLKGFVDPITAGPVIRLMLDKDAPWDISKESFELLTSWLHVLVLAHIRPGEIQLRVDLRDRLLAYWESLPARETADIESGPEWLPRRRRRELDYHLTDEKFVETLALLGADIDDTVQECLEKIAEDAPAFLGPAVDAPLSARAIAQRDPELLATLMEAYYIDEDFSSSIMEEGVRDHLTRWTGFGQPAFQHYFGGFWPLFQSASFDISVRVINRILNHGALGRTRVLSRHSQFQYSDDLGDDEESTGLVLDLDGTPRRYMGDSHVWSWYRGTTVGPYPCMSALLAMERVAEGWLEEGVSPARVVEVLLTGCENLAVPGLLFGLLVRHLESVGAELDPFLAEPGVWELEFERKTHEWSGLKARTEGLKNLDRREWSAREVSMWLVTQGDEARVAALKDVGARLVSNCEEFGIGPELSQNWASFLDADKFEVVKQGDGYYLQVVPPPEVQAAQAENEKYQAQVQTVMRLQSRYWRSLKHDPEYQIPTVDEIAADLVVCSEVLNWAKDDKTPRSPLDAVAQVVRAAITHAGTGEMDALGDHGEFAVRFVLDIAQAFSTAEDQRFEGQYFDLGADRATSLALPSLLTPAFSTLLSQLGVALDEVDEAGKAVAGKSSLETRLFLARGCDVVWSAPCHGSPCMHELALDWLLETARGAEIGPWNQQLQHSPRVQIEGDIAGRLAALDGRSVDIAMLDPAIRGLGSAAATDHCCTGESAAQLETLVDVQRRAMIAHDAKGWTVDHRGEHTLVAARALLSTLAANGRVEPILEHLDVLRAESSIMSNFLHGLAAAGAETEARAGAARVLWPSLMSHALEYVNTDPNPYRVHSWGDWATAALLPEPLVWTQGMYNELSGPPIEWVVAEDLVEHLDSWVSIGRSDGRCADALIRLVRKLPVAQQVSDGLRWVRDLCIRDGQVLVRQSWTSNEWLKEVRGAAEEHGTLDEWQMLVDAMVVAGNEDLAPYSL